MYKKIVTISLSALLASAAFCGCSDSKSSTNATDSDVCVEDPGAPECQSAPEEKPEETEE